MTSTLRLGVMLYEDLRGTPHIIKHWPINEKLGQSYCGLPIDYVLPVLGAEDLCVECIRLTPW